MEHTKEQQKDGDPHRLEILLADYQTCREDERVLFSIQAGVFSVAVTLIGLMAAAVTQTCEFSTSKSCIKTPGYILAATPLIPIALLAYITMLGVAGTLRSYYMRGLEDEIRKHVSAPITSLGTIKPASYVGIVTEVISMRRGRMSYRLLGNLIFVIVIIVFGGFTAYIGFHVGPAEQLAMALLYGGVAVLLVWQVSLGTVRGRSFFVEAAQRFLARTGDTFLPKIHAMLPSSPRRVERSLSSYLIFPRPEDWIKWLIAPGVFLATAWSFGALNQWPKFLALWLILEYLIYEARYQWNDIRGMEEDQAHAERRARARLPVGPDPAVTRHYIVISMSVAVARLVIALLLGWALGLESTVLALLVIVFSIAVVYETLRSGRSALTANTVTLPVAAVWLIVGLGYGVRAGLGFITGGLAAASWQTSTGIACFVALGIMFVLLTWVLEATSFCHIDSGGSWRAKSERRVKPHAMLLLRYVPITLLEAARHEKRGDATESRASDGAGERILVPPGHIATPWNLALAVSAGFGGVLGPVLAHDRSIAVSGVITVCLSLITAGILICCGSQVQRFVVAGAGAVVLVCVNLRFGTWPYTVLAIGPWLAISLLFTFFRGSSYRDLKEFGPRILGVMASLRVVLRSGPWLLRLIVGGATWRVARFGSTVSKNAWKDRSHHGSLPPSGA